MRNCFYILLLLFLFSSCQDTEQDIVWFDDFEGVDQVDPEKWNVVVGNGCPDLCGFGNNELQYYTSHKKNIRVEDGKLIIQALKDSLGGHKYTSAKITSKFKGDWKYGRVEVRAKLPEGKGTWPAIWMLPSVNREMKWPHDGEIDIMEHVGYNHGWVHGTVHTAMYNGMNGRQKTDSTHFPNVHKKFHLYAIEWDESGIEWSVNDEPYNMLYWDDYPEENWPFDAAPFHLIINLAVGGNWAGKHGVDEDIWPQTLEIDYVKILQ